jgi:hypothetical protein
MAALKAHTFVSSSVSAAIRHVADNTAHTALHYPYDSTHTAVCVFGVFIRCSKTLIMTPIFEGTNTEFHQPLKIIRV